MHQAIKNFQRQFSWEPQIEGGELPSNFTKFTVAGMGGSHLAADLLIAREPHLDIIIHSDYGLPRRLAERLIIASSYSGNTEETIDAFNVALELQLPLIAISIGGRLIKLAKDNQIPYIKMPDTGIQPRMALGYSIKAMARAMAQNKFLEELTKLPQLIKPQNLAPKGHKLAEQLKNKIPVIYASASNQAVAYNWKIKFNETGKIPAFYNVLPELNHNEMIGFDIKDSTRDLSNNFYFIFLRDNNDDKRIQKRMEILQKFYQERGLAVKILNLEGRNRFHKMFNSLVLADWSAYYTAREYELDPEQVPMVEEFKGLLK